MSEQDGLINACVLDGKGGGKDMDWEAVAVWQESDGPLWAHLDRNGTRTADWLRRKSGLSGIQVDALLADETRPRVAVIDDGLLMTLRGVNLNPGADPEDMVSLRMWVDHDKIITVRQRRLAAINDLREDIENNKGPVDTGHMLVAIVSGLVRRMAPVIESLNDQIDDLEEHVLEGNARALRVELKRLRRKTIALRRYLSPQRDAITRLASETTSWLGPDLRLAMRECADQVTRIVEDLDAIRERAGVIQDEISNRLAERMNRNMYTLSVVAALMLPLGVVTGMFGMNVQGIPFADNPRGFWFVGVLLVAIVGLQILIFRRLKWI